MNTFMLFFRNFLILTFQKKTAYLLHFAVPVSAFSLMYILLRMGESETFAGTQAIGLVVYFTMVQAALIVSLTLRDREQGVSLRIRISPAAISAYSAGTGAAAYLILTIQVMFFVFFVNFIFPVDIGISFFPLLLIMLVFSLASVGFGFLVCSLSTTSSGAVMVANLVVMFTSFIGGSFFPMEFMKPFMQKIAYILPQYWVMKAIRETQSDESMSGSALSLLILILFGILFIIISNAVKQRKTVI